MIKGDLEVGAIVTGRRFRGQAVVLDVVGARARVLTENWVMFSDCHLAEITLVEAVAEQKELTTEVVAPEACPACGKAL